MRKNIQSKLGPDLEEGAGSTDDENEKHKNVPLPHWLVPLRTQIGKRPFTSFLTLTAILLLAIFLLSVNQNDAAAQAQVSHKKTQKVTKAAHKEQMGSWRDARSKPTKKPKVEGAKPAKASKASKAEATKAAKDRTPKPKPKKQEAAQPQPQPARSRKHEAHDAHASSASGPSKHKPFASLSSPEFAFGGAWAHSERRAHLDASGAPTVACHATTLVNLPSGDVLAAWFGGSYESAEDVAIYVSRRSAVGGWTPPLRAAKVHRNVPFNGKQKRGMPPKQGGEPHWNPVLFCEGTKEGAKDVCDGEISLFFKVGWKIPEWETFVTRSLDGGATWSEAQALVEGDKGGRGPVKNKPILLSNGAWLAPASLEGPAHWEGRRKPWRSFADYSEDAGRTWEASTLVYPENKNEGMIQPTLWESSADPGHVFMMTRSMRGDRARVWRANSTDYGRTWNAPYKTSLPNNNSGLDVAKLPKTGTLVLIYNPVTTTRTPLRLAVSRDNGETWPVHIDLESERGEVRQGREFSYPAIVPWPESRGEEGVSMTYTWNRKRVAYFQISLAELERRHKRQQERAAAGNA